MENLMNFVFNGTNEFTPYTLMCYMVFVLILSCISSIADSLASASR